MRREAGDGELQQPGVLVGAIVNHVLGSFPTCTVLTARGM